MNVPSNPITADSKVICSLTVASRWICEDISLRYFLLKGPLLLYVFLHPSFFYLLQFAFYCNIILRCLTWIDRLTALQQDKCNSIIFANITYDLTTYHLRNIRFEMKQTNYCSFIGFYEIDTNLIYWCYCHFGLMQFCHFFR